MPPSKTEISNIPTQSDTGCATGELPGVVHGGAIILDSPVPALEGRRVRVSLEIVDETTLEVGREDQAKLWEVWKESGPQGPLKEQDGWAE